MKRLLIASTLLILLIGTTAIAPASKFKFAVDEDDVSLKITFPAEFKSEKTANDQYSSINTQAILGEMVFFVGHTSHKNEMRDLAALRQASIDAFVNGINGEIEEQTDWKVQKHQGTKVTFKVADSDIIGDYRVLMVGNVQLQVTAVAPEGEWDEKIISKFFKSLKVKG